MKTPHEGQAGVTATPADRGTSTPYVPSARRLAREQHRRQATIRSTAIAAASTLAVAMAAYVLITNAPGWPRTRETFFDGDAAWAALPEVLEGLWLNVRLMVVCGVLILAFGLLLALARTLRGPVFLPVRLLAAAYTDFFRGLPLIICILVLAYGVPALRLTGVTSDGLYLAGTALVLSYSAYVAEVFRAGIESVHPSQRAAARSLGLSVAQTLRWVVLPQAVRRVIPPLLNDLVSLQKSTGLVSIVGAVDAVYAAQIITAKTFNYTPYIVASVVFIALTIPMTRLTDALAARMNRRQSQGAP